MADERGGGMVALKGRFATVKTLGIIWGFLFLLGGILGFVPGITKNEMFLGFFTVNTAHNILHITSGASSSSRPYWEPEPRARGSRFSGAFMWPYP